MEKEILKAMNDNKTYEQGLADAWEAARKMCMPVNRGGMTDNTLIEIFGTPFTGEIITKNTAAEVIAKIKAYEEEQTEIKVGDEITDGKSKCVVVEKYNDDTGFNQSHLYALDSSGRCFSIYKHNFALYWKKTGRHFPQIEELLNAINNK